MGLMKKLRGELVDIIEWIDDSRSTLAWRYPRYQNEIKNGAELIVREGQKAVFVYRGSLADQFEPGHYTLDSENLPLLSTLQGWKHGFDSPVPQRGLLHQHSPGHRSSLGNAPADHGPRPRLQDGPGSGQRIVRRQGRGPRDLPA